MFHVSHGRSLADAEAEEQTIQHVLGIDPSQQPLEGKRRLTQMLRRDLIRRAFTEKPIESTLCGLQRGQVGRRGITLRGSRHRLRSARGEVRYEDRRTELR